MMNPLIGDSQIYHQKTSGSLHNINNQLFRITLLADLLGNNVKKSDTQVRQIEHLVDEIKSAAFDVAKSGKDLLALIQKHGELEESQSP